MSPALPIKSDRNGRKFPSRNQDLDPDLLKSAKLFQIQEAQKTSWKSPVKIWWTEKVFKSTEPSRRPTVDPIISEQPNVLLILSRSATQKNSSLIYELWSNDDLEILNIMNKFLVKSAYQTKLTLSLSLTNRIQRLQWPEIVRQRISPGKIQEEGRVPGLLRWNESKPESTRGLHRPTQKPAF